MSLSAIYAAYVLYKEQHTLAIVAVVLVSNPRSPSLVRLNLRALNFSSINSPPDIARPGSFFETPHIALERCCPTTSFQEQRIRAFLKEARYRSILYHSVCAESLVTIPLAILRSSGEDSPHLFFMFYSFSVVVFLPFPLTAECLFFWVSFLSVRECLANPAESNRTK